MIVEIKSRISLTSFSGPAAIRSRAMAGSVNLLLTEKSILRDRLRPLRGAEHEFKAEILRNSRRNTLFMVPGGP